MDDLLNEFIAESREMLEALSGEIVAWEAAPGDRARLDEIFRFVHTVKGNCGFFDLPRLEALSHAAEDVLAEVRAGKRSADAALVSAVLAVIDRIGEIVQGLEAGETVPGEDDEQLIAALRERPLSGGNNSSATPVAGTARAPVRSIRLSVDLLDRMMSGVSDMVLARNELARRLREAPSDVAIEAAFDRVSACIGEMRDAITRTRMQRIDNLFAPLPRMVRDLSAELGKQVSLEIDGGDVELDREMIEMIRDPLTHIVRNALDHGLETADEREKAGKPPVGTLRVSARQSGNQILIEIADDGRGIDGEALLKKAIAAGILARDQAERLTPGQRTALIFEPGLSTASEVTAISGRGVGMDVVRANVERIGGLVDIDSKRGQGLRLTLRVPLTLTIIPALTVAVGGRNYAIPRSAIDEIVRSRNGSVRIETLGGARVASIRDRRIPLLSLAEYLGTGDFDPRSEQNLIVLKPAGGDLYALAVDVVHDHEELVVKPAAPLVMAAGFYAGTTLADDGKPILLLDPSGLAATAGVVLDETAIEKVTAKTAPAEVKREEAPALMFKSLDGAKRVIRLALVERIEDAAADAIKLSAGRLRVAIGDRILPLAGCGEVPPERNVRILRLSDGMNEIAYAFAEVIDIITLGADFEPAEAPGGVAGVTLIAGEQVEIIDGFWLFAAHAAGAGERGSRPICALPHDDPWMANILRPIVESAGYEVVAAGSGVRADIVIASAEAEPQGLAAGEIIRIRSSLEASDEGDDSIYRYDRAGLLSALSRRVRGRKG